MNDWQPVIHEEFGQVGAQHPEPLDSQYRHCEAGAQGPVVLCGRMVTGGQPFSPKENTKLGGQDKIGKGSRNVLLRLYRPLRRGGRTLL